LRRTVDNGSFAVEANEMGAVRLLAEGKIPFVAGPTLNVFNAATLGLLADMGARRWVMPPEAGRELLAGMRPAMPAGIATEVFAFGRVPLAYSARCFTARRFNLQKDTCEFKCIDFPDGMTVKTREGEAFLSLNGIQTQSAKVYNLLADLSDLAATGVDVLRISPQSSGTAEVLAAFRTAIDGRPAHLDGDYCNGFWHGRPGLELIGKAA
jgi:collagenase-like PrtC family protease